MTIGARSRKLSELIPACRKSPNQPNADRSTNPRHPNRPGSSPLSTVRSPQSKIQSQTRVLRLETVDTRLRTFLIRTCLPRRTSRCARMARLERRPPARRVPLHPNVLPASCRKIHLPNQSDLPARRMAARCRALPFPTLRAASGFIAATASNCSTPSRPNIPTAGSTPSLPTRLISCLPGRSF